jgi:hypothetical protein
MDTIKKTKKARFEVYGLEIRLEFELQGGFAVIKNLYK